MASSGYLGTSNQYIVFWTEIITNSQNIANNTSNVTVRVWAKRTNTGFTTSGSGTVYLRIAHDTTVYENTKSSSIEITSTSKIYHEWTGNVSHTGDGSRWLQVTANIQISGILSSSSAGYGEWLKTIPRTSSFTLSKTSCELGTAFSVSITRASTAFTHSVSYIIGSERRYMQAWNGTAISVSYTPPVSDCTYFKNSTSTSVTIQVDTYSGSTLIGTSSKTLTITAPSSVVPTFSSLGISRVNNTVPSTWGIYVKGKSKATLTINSPAGVYGSTISKYSIIGAGFSGTSQTLTTGALNTAGTHTFTATITDSRGRTATKTNSLTVIDYYKPSISKFTAERCLSDGTVNEDGTYLKITLKIDFASVSSKNTLAAKIKFRETGGVWGTEVAVTNNSSSIIGAGAISVDKSYEVLLTATDAFESVTKSAIVQTAFVTMDFLNGGKGVAIGKVAETDNCFDVNMPSVFRDKVTVANSISLYDYSTQTDTLDTVKSYLRIFAGTSTQIIVDDLTASVRPSTSYDYTVKLGASNARWKELWVGAYRKASSGFDTLPNGMIIQWGLASASTASSITFPIAFSTAVYAIQVTPYTTVDAASLTYRTASAHTGGFSLYSTKAVSYYWIAIGY